MEHSVNVDLAISNTPGGDPNCLAHLGAGPPYDITVHPPSCPHHDRPRANRPKRYWRDFATDAEALQFARNKAAQAGARIARAVMVKVSKQALLEDFKPLIFALRLHAVTSAIRVCQKPKPEYSPDQSLQELFTMWSNLYWIGTLGPQYDKQEYYQKLEADVKAELNLDINAIVNGFFILKVKQYGKMPEPLHHQFLEFIYIVRTDAVNKMLQVTNEKSPTRSFEEILQELISGWNPEKVGDMTNS